LISFAVLRVSLPAISDHLCRHDMIRKRNSSVDRPIPEIRKRKKRI
jgi:hypothetical protein